MAHYAANGVLTQAEATAMVRTTTKVVAASDSSAEGKGLADYVCDGTADNVQIQAAIDALPTIGGKVILLEGTYYISSPIIINRYLVSLWGQGVGHSTWSNTRIELADNSDCNMIEIESNSGVSYVAGVDLQGFFLYGNKANQASGHGIYANYAAGVTVVNVGVRDMKENGIMFAATDASGHNWHIFLTRVFSNANDGNGVDIFKTEFRATDCFFESNVIGFRGRRGRGGVRHLNNCHLEGNTSYSIHSVDSLLVTGCALANIYLDINTESSIVGNCISNSVASYAIAVAGAGGGTHSQVKIVGNHIKSTNDGIHLDNVYGVLVAENSMDITGTPLVYTSVATIANNRVRDNYGYVTENTGVATNVTLDGSGEGVIAHGCDDTPTYANVICQSDNLNIRVTAIDGTNIDILVQDLDGNVVTADTHDFYWEAKVR